MYNYIAQTISGTKKKINEDRIFINGHILADGEYAGSADRITAIVCDGVGGEHGGEYAASIATSDCLAFDSDLISSSALIRHLINTNEDILRLQDDYYYFRNMSATIAGLCIAGDACWFFNLGDTRVYKYSDGVLSVLSTDHTLAAQMLKDGVISSMDEARKSEKNTLTKYLGGRGSISRPVVKSHKVTPKDTLFIVCSDGIYKSFKDLTDFQRMLESASDIRSKKEAIMQHSLHNGTADDKSIVIVSVQ